jgi:YggT family protein
MSDNRPPHDKAVDRRDETVVTQEAGYVSTEQVTHDVAAERRQQFDQIIRIIWTISGILAILLGLRFVLKLIGANPDSGFTVFIYGITGLFVAPFEAIVGTPTAGGSVLEVTTLIAIAVYALLFWVVVRVLQVAADRPSSRTVTRSTREQIDDRYRRPMASEIRMIADG